MVRVVSLSVLLTLIVFLGVMFFQVVAPFLLPLFLAGVTAVLCQPLFEYFLRRTRQRVMLSAGVTTTIVLLAILVPLSVGTIMAAAQLYVLSQDALTQTKWNRTLEWVQNELDFDVIFDRVEPYLVPLIVPDAAARQPAVEILPPPEDAADISATENLSRRPPPADGRESDSRGASATRPPTSRFHVNHNVPNRDPNRGIDENDPPVQAWKPFDPLPVDASAELQLAYAQIEEDITRPIAEELLQVRLDQFKDQFRANMQNALLTLSQRTLMFAGATVNTTLDILGALVAGLLGFIMFAIALFFFLADGPKMLTTMQELIPVHREYQRELWHKFENVIRAVVLATFLSAISQGLLTSIALFLAGFRHFFIIWLLATAMSLIPLAGNWIVWLPCAIYLAYSGAWGTAIALALFGFLVISTIDNVIKTYVLQSDAKLHPLLAFVSVLGGLRAMGLAGIFVAPVVASTLHALVKIFNAELRAFSKQKFGAHDDETVASSALLDAEFDSPESALVVKRHHAADPDQPLPPTVTTPNPPAKEAPSAPQEAPSSPPKNPQTVPPSGGKSKRQRRRKK